MAIELNQREIIEALGNLDFNTMGARGLSGLGSIQNIGTNLAGTPNINYLQNLANLAQQQEPQLGPDEFGSYTIPASDPTYRSGFDYARSIAGGIPMSQVIAPGVSYSPEQPMGYTQAQLNTPVGTTPVEPPPTQEPDDPRYLGTGIGGVNIPVDRKDIPFRDIFGGFAGLNKKPHISHTRFDEMFPQSGLNQIQNLINIDDAPQSYRFDPITRKMIPVENTTDMTGKIIGNNAREPIPPQPFGGVDLGGTSIANDGTLGDLPPGLRMRETPPTSGPVMPPGGPIPIRPDLLPPKINDQIFIDDRPIIDERIVDRGYGPGIMPPLPPMDIDKVIPPVDIPPIDIPFIPFIKPPSIMDRPTGGRFSVDQQLPRGLF